MGVRDDSASGVGSCVCRCVAISHHARALVCFVAWDASFDCWTAVACGAEAVLDSPCAARGVAGADQLQPFLVVAVVRVRAASSAVVLRVVGGWAGARFLLFGGATAAPSARAESGCSKGGECAGGCGLVSGAAK
jgi:hypothetical protein